MSNLTQILSEDVERVVYKATSPSGKIYIGKTVRSMKYRRMMHYATMYKENTAFAKALRKYGKQMEWEVLGTYSNDEELRKAEIDFIAKYDSYNSGYNLTLGGEGHAGFKHSQDTILKRGKSLSKALTGRRLSDSHKKALSLAKKGKPSVRLGARLSDKSKQRISKFQESKIKPVVCNETGQEFRTAREAAKYFGADRGNLMKHLKRVKYFKTIKGYTFSYKNEVTNVQLDS